MKSVFIFKIGLIVSVILLTVPPQRNHTMILCLFVVGISSLIPNIIEVLKFFTAPFGHYAQEFCAFELLLFLFLCEIS